MLSGASPKSMDVCTIEGREGVEIDGPNYVVPMLTEALPGQSGRFWSVVVVREDGVNPAEGPVVHLENLSTAQGIRVSLWRCC